MSWKNSRKYIKKAWDRINEIKAKYPSGIPDIMQIGEESRAWLQMKIQQMRECLKNVKFPSLPSWWETLRLSRNKTAHQTEDFTDEEFSDLAEKLFSNIEKISKNLQATIEHYRQKSKKKRKFENTASPVFGSTSERKQLVDAMEDSIDPVEPRDIKIEFPKNDYAKLAEKTLSEILEHENVKDYAPSHEGFSENIQTDILEWLQQTRSSLEKEDPFVDEAVFIAQMKKLSAIQIATDLSDEKSNSQDEYETTFIAQMKKRFAFQDEYESAFITEYQQLPSVNESSRGNIAPSNIDFDFYSKEFAAQKKVLKNDSEEKEQKIKWKSAEKLETLRRNFIADLERNLIERKNKWEQERIEELRKKFLEELYQKIRNFMRLEKLVSPFIDDLGRLWDLSKRPFETSGFEILDQFAKLLEHDESLQELARMIGRQSRTQAMFEKELRDKVVIKTEWIPQRAYRGGIEGIRYSNDISAVLPVNLAMLTNPAAKKLFQLEFAQKQLQSFDYRNYELKSKEEKEQKEISVEKKEPKGPVIICVDTSGSMQGTPENIAKTVTFALSKIAISEKRKCYLISFSTNIETLDMSDFKTGDALRKLVQFLQKSFNGGTDASPALKHSVEMLHKDDYKNADVLMISDFVMETLPDDLIKSIEAEKEKNTNFYSLVIGSSGNQGTIECFNRNWLYNTNDPHAQRHLVEQLHELQNREIEKN